MLFIAVRLLFSALLFLLGKIIIKKCTMHIKHINLIMVISTALLYVILLLIPVENLFVTFPSAEQSYKYNHTANVKIVVEGKTTDFVIGKNKNIYNPAIVPKSQAGWKIGMPLETKTVKNIFEEGYAIEVYRYSNTDEYYLSVFNAQGNKCEISDSISSKYYEIQDRDNLFQEPLFHYYSYLENYSGQFSLFVNDSTITISI